MFTARIYKDPFNGVSKQWTADVYKDGVLQIKAWMYGFKTKKSLVQEIGASLVTVTIES